MVVIGFIKRMFYLTKHVSKRRNFYKAHEHAVLALAYWRKALNDDPDETNMKYRVEDTPISITLKKDDMEHKC